MATFIGFNTVDQFKKFTLTDFELIKRDLINALNIRQGELPGRPGYGTIIWSYVFENQSSTMQENVKDEIQRVVGGDPRLSVSNTEVYPQDNGLRIELTVQVVGSYTSERLALFFNEESRRASYI
jgi:phage baseplate assembly protein W